MPVLIPDKVSYGTKNTTREKDIWIIIIKKNHFKEENGTKCCSPNNIGLKYIKKKKQDILCQSIKNNKIFGFKFNRINVY